MGFRQRKNTLRLGGRDVLIEKIIRLIQDFLQEATENKKGKYVLLIALTGILLIVLSNLLSPKKETSDIKDQETDAKVQEDDIEDVSLITNVNEIETSYEKDLQTMLNQIKGVSEAEVMVNIDSTNVNVYEKDLITGMQSTEESDKNGGQRKVEDETKETKLVYIRQGDQEEPVLVQTKKPEDRGVYIIATGGDN